MLNAGNLYCLLALSESQAVQSAGGIALGAVLSPALASPGAAAQPPLMQPR